MYLLMVFFIILITTDYVDLFCSVIQLPIAIPTVVCLFCYLYRKVVDIVVFLKN